MTHDDRATSLECCGNRRWYDSVATTFVRRYDGVDGEYFRKFEEDVFASLVGEGGGYLLDLGCGHGRLVRRFSAQGGRKAVGVDLSLEMLRQGGQGLPVAQANAAALCFPDGIFSVVVCMGLFEYMSDPSAFLREIHRVTAPGGLLALTFHQVREGEGAPVQSGDTPYFGRTVAERDGLWMRVVRPLRRIEADLAKAGYESVRVRRVFFRPSQLLFRLGARMRHAARPLGEAAILCALMLERLLAALFSRNSNGNTIILARKPVK